MNLDTAWVLVRRTDGCFVAVRGRKSSYTRNVQHAQLFASRSEAENNSCYQSESPIPLRELFEGYHA